MLMLDEQNLDLRPPPLDKFLKKYGEGRRRRNMELLYQKLLEEAGQHAQPRFMFEAFPPAAVPDLQSYLSADSQGVVLGVCTLGHALHERLAVLGKEDSLAEYVLNEIGIEWLRRMVRELHQALRQSYAQQGLKLGPTYRPGVGKWPLETQRTIFSLLNTGPIGVSLDEHLFMLPILSNSLIIPVSQL